MKIFYLLSVVFLLSSCATSKYHFEIAGRYDDYNQEFEGPPIVTVNPPITSVRSNFFNFKAPGAGVQVGILETAKISWGRIGYFYSAHENQNFTFESVSSGTTTELIKLKTHGLEWAGGFNIWWFKPYISINYLVNDLEYDNSELDSHFTDPNKTLIGAGLALVFDLSDKTQLVFNGHYRGGTTAYSMGLAFYMGTIGSDSNEGRRR